MTMFCHHRPQSGRAPWDGLQLWLYPPNATAQWLIPPLRWYRLVLLRLLAAPKRSKDPRDWSTVTLRAGPASPWPVDTLGARIELRSRLHLRAPFSGCCGRGRAFAQPDFNVPSLVVSAEIAVLAAISVNNGVCPRRQLSAAVGANDWSGLGLLNRGRFCFECLGYHG